MEWVVGGDTLSENRVKTQLCGLCAGDGLRKLYGYGTFSSVGVAYITGVPAGLAETGVVGAEGTGVPVGVRRSELGERNAPEHHTQDSLQLCLGYRTKTE